MKGDGLFGEWEAAYFSHLRDFAKSDTAHKVTERNDRMNANEYIDAISRDLQDLITALDNDPNTLEQVPDAPPYKIGDEGYRDRVTCGVNAPKDEWWYYDSHLN